MRDEVTLGVALLGAALGVLNWWRNFTVDRVRLRVTPLVYQLPDGRVHLCVQVVNLSTFDVTVNEVGFTIRPAQRTAGRDHLQLLGGSILEGGQHLPVRLKPRTVATVVTAVAAGAKSQDLRGAWRLYVVSACGVRRYARQRAFNTALEYLAAARPQVVAYPIE